ncbi:uncharacterized protein [Nicotiana tomentosiformis]|uniref:uncharacterized protein n=1 Tax=Nicotiana tomentosiformis TaxID=4098 RepID=UPI00388CBC07
MPSPWMVAGDFNSIVEPEEKKGGRIHSMSKSLPFINCIVGSGLMDFGYCGNPFTWCNGWAYSKRIWARLDRALVNSEWLQNFPDTSVVHLVRNGSDHAPLLISTANNQWEPKKYFRFLDFWTEQEDFLKVVEQAWNTIGNIVDKIKELQNRLAEHEDRCLNDNSECNRMEYNNVRLPRVIGEDDNLTLEAIPTMNEVKQMVFSMSSSSSPGPDGLSGKFFHHCWDIIAKDLYDVILDFFFGSELPRSFTYTCLVLIPKIDNPNNTLILGPLA